MKGRSIRDDFETDKTRHLFSLLTQAERFEDRVLKLVLAKELLRSTKLANPGLDRDGVMLLVEEFGGLRSRSHLWSLVESMGLLECRDGRYRLREKVTLEDVPGVDLPSGFRGRPHPLADAGWTLDEIRSALFPKPEPRLSLNQTRNAVSDGYGWLLWTLSGADQNGERSPLPAFWECHLEGDTPIGRVRAITSVGDTLGALVDSLIFPWCARRLGPADASPVNHAVKELLTFVFDAEEGDWNHGGFDPVDDQPETDHPTCDATWDAVLALSSVHDGYDTLVERFGGPLSATRGDISTALLNGVAFLFRMQLPKGAWGIYRYEGDGFPVSPHEFTTAQTILALRLSLLTSAYEDAGRPDLRAACEAALDRAWAFLWDSRLPSGPGQGLWAPNLDPNGRSVRPVTVLCASMWTATGVLALRRAGIAPPEQTTDCLNTLVAFADRHWEPDYTRIAEFEFRVPRQTQLHDTFGKWSNRFDVTLAIILLDIFNERCEQPECGLIFPESLWPRLEDTVGAILSEQHPTHGHWNEPVAGLPLAAATAMAIQALQQYLIAARHLTVLPHVPSEAP